MLRESAIVFRRRGRLESIPADGGIETVDDARRRSLRPVRSWFRCRAQRLGHRQGVSEIVTGLPAAAVPAALRGFTVVAPTVRWHDRPRHERPAVARRPDSNRHEETPR
jgi:hypothetical protein